MNGKTYAMLIGKHPTLAGGHFYVQRGKGLRHNYLRVCETHILIHSI